MAYTTVDDSSAHFQAVIYTGNGSDDLAITFSGNSDLQPDLLWFKSRDGTQGHELFDSTRGVAESLRPHNNDVANIDSPNDRLMSFDSDGFELDDDGNPNTNTNTYVAWGWKCNGGTATATVAESGDNPANVRQTNTTTGLSIITYTGTGGTGTIAHGLGVAPSMIWNRVRNDNGDTQWFIYHKGLASDAETDFIHFDQSSARQDAAVWNDTAPTSSVYSLGSSTQSNDDDSTFVSYVWADVQGFSKFGKYKGNGDADGPFVYTGFKPAFLLVKRIDGTGYWAMMDNIRDPDNTAHHVVFANVSDDETDSSNYDTDFLSNGFKIRSTLAARNTDGENFLYAAFAEQPFVTSGGVPCTAR